MNNLKIDIVTLKDLENTDIEILKDEFIALNRTSNQSIFEMGKRLIVIKSKLKIKGEKYSVWLKDKANFSQSLANKYVKLVNSYTEETSELVTNLGIKKAYKLLVADKTKNYDINQLIEFIHSNNILNLSYNELCDLVDDSKVMDIHNYHNDILRSLKRHIKAIDENKIELTKEQKQILKLCKDLETKIISIAPVAEELAKEGA